MVIHPGSACFHRIIEGFADAAAGHGEWDVRWDFVTESVVSRLPVLTVWKPQVVVCAVAAALPACQKLGCPVIGMGTIASPERAVLDEVAIGRLAADHLLERGLRRLATFAPGALSGRSWWGVRAQGFVRRARASGVDPILLPGQPESDPAWIEAFIARLREDPEPIGIFAGNDHFGRVVAQACQDHGLPVPDRVAIIGADDDPWMCLLSATALSSIAVPHRALGAEAARLVARRLSDRDGPPREVALAPDGVMVRRSTAVAAVLDPLVGAAMSWIDAHATDAIRVEGLARHLGCSRRTLELRFRRATGESVLTGIQRVRVRRAEVALRQPGRGLEQVARLCGFASQTRFTAVFREITGLTPAVYRDRLTQAS